MIGIVTQYAVAVVRTIAVRYAVMIGRCWRNAVPWAIAFVSAMAALEVPHGAMGQVIHTPTLTVGLTTALAISPTVAPMVGVSVTPAPPAVATATVTIEASPRISTPAPTSSNLARLAGSEPTATTIVPVATLEIGRAHV